MESTNSCKFFYLKEISFGIKGEMPSYDCEKGHDVNTDCTKSCSDFQKTQAAK